MPWTKAGHVVVLMGVNRAAGALEFSDPLTGGYNGTTMAQFARTFTIYGDMAIVIERTARAPVHILPARRIVATPRAVATPAATPTPSTLMHRLLATSSFDTMTAPVYLAAGIGAVSRVTAATPGGAGLWLASFAAAAVVILTTATALAVLRRRRRRCAG